MAERVHKSFRLPEDLAAELDRYAAEHSLSATAVTEEALRDYLGRGTPRGTHVAQDVAQEAPGVSEAIRALTDQLEVKDRHIEALTERLADAQATARAAQALEGAQVAKELAAPVDEPEEKADALGTPTGFLRRLSRRFRRT